MKKVPHLQAIVHFVPKENIHHVTQVRLAVVVAQKEDTIQKRVQQTVHIVERVVLENMVQKVVQQVQQGVLIVSLVDPAMNPELRQQHRVNNALLVNTVQRTGHLRVLYVYQVQQVQQLVQNLKNRVHFVRLVSMGSKVAKVHAFRAVRVSLTIVQVPKINSHAVIVYLGHFRKEELHAEHVLKEVGQINLMLLEVNLV